MKILTERDRLENYYDAIAQMSAENGNRKIDAISAKNLPRYFSANAPLELIQIFSRRIKDLKLSELSTFEKARIALANNDEWNAETLLLQALAEGDQRANFDLGVIAKANEQWSKAMDYFAAAVEHNFDAAKALNLMGVIALILDDPNAATKCLRLSTLRHKIDRELGFEGCKEAFLNLGQLFSAAGEQDAAIACLSEGLKAGELRCINKLAAIYKTAGMSKELDELLASAQNYGLHLQPPLAEKKPKTSRDVSLN